ncbi:MAG: DUF4838 domain-containing protein [Victivallales bacterium]|nr:DUF4838 domain-containing protein [Victivallales bacterium]
MNKYFVYIALNIIFIAIIGSSVHAEIPFVVDGDATNRFIVTDYDPVPVAQFAARELGEYLEKITGAVIFNEIGLADRFTGAIVVGYGPLARKYGLTLEGLKPDGFRIVTKGKFLFIYGVDRQVDRPVLAGVTHMAKIHSYDWRNDISAFGECGTLYGVYYFLREYCGVRWFAPGELGEVCPKQTDLVIPEIDITVNPDFEYRITGLGLFNYNHDSSRWYHRAGFGAPRPVEINHSFYLMNKYQKEHPEWFALLKDGRRDFNVTCEGRGSLCLSNPELLQAYIQEARSYFDHHPEQEIFCVMPNDWFNQICECPECQAQADYDKPIYGQFSNYVWNFVNEVAKEVKKTHPDKFIGCCAYNSYMMIPDRVELEDNIAVMQTKALYYRFDDFYRWRNDELAYDWAKKTKRFYIWDYYCWDSTQPHLTGLPIAFAHWLSTDLCNLKGTTRGFFFCGDEKPPFYQFPVPAHNSFMQYLTGRLLWDSSLDVDALIDDYCEKYFGPAAAPMKCYWTRAEELWCNMDVKKRGPADNLNGTLYTPEVLRELAGYLEQAAALAPVDSDYAKRVQEIQKVFLPYMNRVVTAKDTIPATTVKLAANAPVIDGQREEAWDSAEELLLGDKFTGAQPTVKTAARILHDAENIYFLVECEEPRMNNLTANCTVNDRDEAQIWNDDAVEIFLAPDSRIPGHCVQIIVNTNGCWWDAAKGTRSFPQGKESEYNSDLTVHVAKSATGWTVELAIPKASLALDGTPPHTEWRANICRDRNVSGIDTKEAEGTCWSPVQNPFWFRPDRFGFLKYQEN